MPSTKRNASFERPFPEIRHSNASSRVVSISFFLLVELHDRTKIDSKNSDTALIMVFILDVFVALIT
jgi:hypothetical protein